MIRDGVPEWSKGMDLKSTAKSRAGSNPAAVVFAVCFDRN